MNEKRKYEINEEISTIEIQKKKIKFRNYQPKEILLENKIKEEEKKVERTRNENIIQKELKRYQKEELNFIPRNFNFDIKNILEKRIKKLNKRTQKIIIDLLREKLANLSDSEESENEKNS